MGLEIPEAAAQDWAGYPTSNGAGAEVAESSQGTYNIARARAGHQGLSSNAATGKGRQGACLGVLWKAGQGN